MCVKNDSVGFWRTGEQKIFLYDFGDSLLEACYKLLKYEEYVFQ